MSLLEYRDAARVVAEFARTRSTRRATEAIPLLRALGRVLATDVVADRDQPPFPRSTRDGFCGRAEDLNRGTSLRVAGMLRAGEPAWAGPLAPGDALEIMTGAPVPAGADCVAMVEHVRREGSTVSLTSGRCLRPGENIVATGSEARAGSPVLRAGARLGPAQIAAAAAVGAADLQVWARPRVAIVATGDELVEVSESPLPHQIRNSNSYSLAAAAAAAGGDPVQLPVARDELSSLRARLVEAASRAELLLLSGGVSMGQYDLVEQALSERGAEFFFTGVKMQPGKPVVFGTLPGPEREHRLPFFGLPGNPVSTMVTFSLFAAPLVRALGGEDEPRPPFAQAKLTHEVRVKPGLTRFLPGKLVSDWDGAHVELVKWEGSGDLAGTALANCFVVAPPEAEVLPPGASVSVLLA